jgi:hypothetical protein
MITIILLSKIMGGGMIINRTRVFAFKIYFKLKKVSLNITHRGYNVDGGYYDWRGKDVREDERVEEDGGEQYERVDGDNDEDEGDDVNARGLGDEGDDCNVRDSEDRDDIPSIHGSTSSPMHHEQRVQKKGFDTHKDPITKKKSFIYMEQQSKLNFIRLLCFIIIFVIFLSFSNSSCGMKSDLF